MGLKRASGTTGVVVAVLFLISMVLAGIVSRHFGEAPAARDVLADLDNAYRSADPADDAWPLYQKALHQQVIAPSVLNCYHAWPGDPGWEETLQWLDANRDVIPLLVEATSLRNYGRPYDPARLARSWVDFHSREGNAAELLLARQKLQQVSGRVHAVWEGSCSSLLKSRDLVNLVCAAARESAAVGDLDRALALLVTAAGMGRHQIERAFVIETMIGVALYSTAGEQVQPLLREHADRLTGKQLEHLADSILCRYSFPDVETVLEKEWRVQRAIIDAGFSDDGFALIDELHRTMCSGGQGGGWQEFIEKAALLLHAGKQETLEQYDAVREAAIAAADDPSRMVELQRLREGLGEYRHALVRACDPGVLVENTSSVLRSAMAKRDATAALVATLRYRLAAGTWPASAEALVPRYLPALPIDVEPGTLLQFVPAHGDQPPTWKSTSPVFIRKLKGVCADPDVGDDALVPGDDGADHRQQ